MFKGYLKTCIAILFLGISPALFSQNIGINTTGTSPSTNAILDLNSGNSGNLGLIIPNVTLGASLSTFSPPMANAATVADVGMMVFNSVATNQSVGYYYWTGSSWTNVSGSSTGNVAACGSAAANYIPYFTASNTVCKSAIYQSGTTSVGINTTNPKNTLDVNGAVAVGSYAGVNTAPAGTSMIVSGQVGIGTNSPNASAIMDITSTTLGLLTPRMTSAQIAAISSPAIGLIVYNTSTNCLEFNSNGTTTGWNDMICPCSGAPSAVTPSGTTLPNTSTTYTYTCPTSTNATTYTWSVSSTNASITSGNGTQTVTVAFNSTSTTLNICVTAGNTCGTSSQSCLTVSSCNGTITHGNQTFNWNGTSTVVSSYTENNGGTLQTFTVPACVTTITVVAAGGSGGGNEGFAGGKGAVVTATVTVVPNDILDIVAGAAVNAYGIVEGTCSGDGGGGGSFVWDASSTTYPLVAAGGGGGAGGQNQAGNAGSTTTAANNSANDGTTGTAAGGAGGSWGTTTGNPAAATSNIGAGGVGEPGNFAGGAGCTTNCIDAPLGGYGGGGGGGESESDYGGGGGGGGYVGGAGGNANTGSSTTYAGGGGGSGWYIGGYPYTTAADFGNNATYGTVTQTNTGNGYVTIYW